LLVRPNYISHAYSAPFYSEKSNSKTSLFYQVSLLITHMITDVIIYNNNNNNTIICNARSVCQLAESEARKMIIILCV